MQDGILNKVRGLSHRRYLSRNYVVTIILVHNDSLTETVIRKNFSVRLHFELTMFEELEKNLKNYLSKFHPHYEELEQIYTINMIAISTDLSKN